MQLRLISTVMSLLYTWGNWVIERSAFRPSSDCHVWWCLVQPSVLADRTVRVLCQPAWLPVGDRLREVDLCGLSGLSLCSFMSFPNLSCDKYIGIWNWRDSKWMEKPAVSVCSPCCFVLDIGLPRLVGSQPVWPLRPVALSVSDCKQTAGWRASVSLVKRTHWGPRG